MSTLDLSTSFTEALRKRKRTERTYVGDKGRDDPVTAILRHVGIDSQAKYRQALKASRTLFDTPEQATADEIIAGRNVSDQLNREFPGWNWLVVVEEGVLRFYAKEISLKMGVSWSLMKGHPHPAWIRKEAGEMLERYRAPRKVRDITSFLADAKYEYGKGGLHMRFDR